MSSLAGVMPAPLAAPYCAAKHALQGYFSSLRAELAAQHQHGGAPQVSITLACPGPVVSPGSGAAILSATADCATFTQSTGVEVSQAGRMPTQRCAALALSAAGARLPEAWMGPQPALLLAYVAWLCPSVRHAIEPTAAHVRAGNLQAGSPSLSSGLLSAVVWRVCSCAAAMGAAAWLLDTLSLALCACGYKRVLRGIVRCATCQCRAQQVQGGTQSAVRHAKVN